jgi:hypothetical protein
VTKLPLFFASDITVGTSTMYADYIFPRPDLPGTVGVPRFAPVRPCSDLQRLPRTPPIAARGPAVDQGRPARRPSSRSTRGNAPHLRALRARASLQNRARNTPTARRSS